MRYNLQQYIFDSENLKLLNRRRQLLVEIGTQKRWVRTRLAEVEHEIDEAYARIKRFETLPHNR